MRDDLGNFLAGWCGLANLAERYQDARRGYGPGDYEANSLRWGLAGMVGYGSEPLQDGRTMNGLVVVPFCVAVGLVVGYVVGRLWSLGKLNQPPTRPDRPPEDKR